MHSTFPPKISEPPSLHLFKVIVQLRVFLKKANKNKHAYASLLCAVILHRVAPIPLFWGPPAALMRPVAQTAGHGPTPPCHWI